MPAPYSEPSGIDSLVDLFTFNNEVLGGNMFGDLTVGVIWVIVWAMFSQYYRERPQLKALIVSSFAAFFLAVMLDLLSLVSRFMITLTFAGLCLSLIADKILEDNSS